MKRIPQLDGVRGVAILFILIWHYLPRSVTPPLILRAIELLWSGVDLFFVLSGFLIAGILLDNVGKQNYYKIFYLRRSARILPLYMVFVLSLALIELRPPFGLKSTEFNLIPMWSYLTFTQNFMMAHQQRFSGVWLAVSWSLALEEQFYVFLAFLVRLLDRNKVFIVTISLIFLAPIARLLSASEIAAYILPLQRADSLMAGVLLALIWQNESARQTIKKHAGVFHAIFGFLCLGFIALTYKKVHYGDPLVHLYLAFFYLNFLILALVTDKGIIHFFLTNTISEWFGLRSYGMYLFQLPILYIIPVALWYFKFPPINAWAITLIDLIALFSLCEISYRFFERPIMNLAHKFQYS